MCVVHGPPLTVAGGAELQLKLKQKYEKMEKQREHAARVDAILIQLMKKHAPEIAEKLEADSAASSRAAQVTANGAPAPTATAATAAAGVKREGVDAADAAAKRQKTG